ncbi:MAG: DUF302 domain-containing protein [Candidatus Cloacimonetes bacterium]|nr:DUF302 domain-containing protein [Candidatus Cloacimonadota bacterium]
MRKIIYLIVGIIIGAILTGILVWNQMPGLLLVRLESQHDFDTTVDMLEENAFAGGWEVISVVDVQQRLEGYGYEDFLRMKIIEICHGEHSYTIFQDDENKKVAGIMPCRFAVYEQYDGKVMISKMNIGLMSKMFGGLIQRVMGTVAGEERVMLEGVVK